MREQCPQRKDRARSGEKEEKPSSMAGAILQQAGAVTAAAMGMAPQSSSAADIPIGVRCSRLALCHSFPWH